MRIITLKEEEFDNYAKRHKYDSIYQTSPYAKFRKNHEKYDIHYLGFEENGHLIGATMVIYKELFWGYKYAYAPRGFLVDYTNKQVITELTQRLINLLKKQKFIFVKLDPPIIIYEKDFTGKIIYQSDTANDIINTLKSNRYEHLGFNLYNESLLSRFNVFAKLIPNEKNMYFSFDKEIQENIKDANRRAINVYIDDTNDIDVFFNYIKRSYGKKGRNYFERLINNFTENNSVKIFYAKLDSNKYAQNTNNLYNKELERNEGLTRIIESGNKKYDIEKVINDKILSDKLLKGLKKDIIVSTDLLRNNPDGIICGTALVVQNKKGAEILVNYIPKEFKNFKANEALTFEIMKYYSKQKLKYINLGSVFGNFDQRSRFYPLLETKKGFNSSIIEYIGEFDLIVNPLMYKVYKNRSKKKKLI